ncbi:chaperone NapD [Tabrizicola oligotrophica]|uniref:Chaperone NapD n=1 Tax=Tabrizicola oligotrophica TaxID=2710650 RepID=A0A6M0QXE2_9RHOB|nr:chaperone NapD [Tabrizicola oligotrophica]NEY92057.1 chaperone NapD [Tabrizicola oligotrophica]
MTDELHIASFALRCDPAQTGDLLAALRALPGVTIGTEDAASGKAVVVMEAPDDRTITRTLAEIQLMPGVVNAALVYQHILNTDELTTTEGSPT